MKKIPEKFLFFSLVLFSSLVTAGGFLMKGTLYWDTGKIFTQFRDNLHSLNRFGEIAWWFPHTLSGFPGYYHSILGIPSSSNPMAAVLSLVVWGLGRLGIFIDSYHAIYVFYFGFLIPFFFLWAFRSVLRQFFKSQAVIYYALILAAFSPGISFNLSDVGYLEPQIYFLFFVSAYLNFLKLPTRQTFWVLTFAFSLIGISTNHAFLYFAILFLPIVVLMTFKRLRVAAQAVPKRYWAVTIGVLFLCAAPNLIAYTQGDGIIRTSIGDSKSYPYEKLEAGNPLEALLVSLPGFGFDWRQERQNWTLLPESTKYHTAYNYLGLLCIPLVLVGLLFGSSRLRIPLMVFLVLFLGVVGLASYSPIFSTLLAWNSPFRSCSHFSDGTFKAGSYLFLIMAAALGFKAVLQRRRLRGRFFVGLFLVNLFVGVMVSLYLLDKKVAESLPFGLLVFFGFAYFILTTWFSFAGRYLERQKAAQFLLWLTLLDCSTFMFLHVRSIWKSELVLNSGWPAHHRVDETPNRDDVGLLVGGDKHFYPSILMVFEPYLRMVKGGLYPSELPETELYYSAREIGGVAEERKRILDHGAGWETALPFDNAVLGSNAVAPFAGATLSVVPRKEILVEKKSYNEFQFRVITDRPALFFLRDGFSPYWKASVNEKPADIWRAYFNFKAIAVPAGTSFVRFTFYPTGIGFSLFLAYGIIFLLYLRTVWDAVSLPQWRLRLIRVLGRVFPSPSQA